MKKLFVLGLIISVVIALVVGGCSQPAPPKPAPAPAPAPAPTAAAVKIDFVSFTPPTNKWEFGLLKANFIDKVNERAKGAVTINVRGGPEVIPPFNLGAALQQGTIQMSAVPTGFFESVVPGADCFRLSDFTVAEEAKNGAYDYLKDLYAKKGIFYMGRADPSISPFFYLFSNKKIEKLEDFVGTKISGSPSFHGFYKGLGGIPVVIPITEYYTAMERGTVDIGSSSIYVWIDAKSYEVSKYCINHPFFTATPAMMVNLEAWNKIPKATQDMMLTTFAEHQKAWLAADEADRANSVEFLKKNKVEIVTFAPDVAKKYLDIARDSSWDFDVTRYPPDVVNSLRKLMTKAK
jgi:TRAP-type C4-dicarboxylate transport system substrate-binding protein